MDELENFMVEGYKCTTEDETLILEADYNWEKTCLEPYKERVRDELMNQQNYRCAYCRMPLHAGEATPEIEHIVPKSLRPKWMFEPRNLCVSCKLCNTKKGHSKQILADESLQYLPEEGNSYLIVHPHWDNYFDHIEIVDGLLYKGLTEKGKYLIYVCDLSRYQLAIDRAKLLMLNKSEDSYLKLLLVAIDPQRSALIDDKEKFLTNLKKIDTINKYLRAHAIE